MDFQLSTTYKPQGDQPRAIAELISGIHAGEKDQVLLGVTGSGKTFTMAKVIEELQRPALILAHNKTLAAQLYHEFKTFFPNNAVEYFVSYYDYYQPEAYIPAGDLFIEKESTINEELDKLRLAATRTLFHPPTAPPSIPNPPTASNPNARPPPSPPSSKRWSGGKKNSKPRAVSSNPSASTS